MRTANCVAVCLAVPALYTTATAHEDDSPESSMEEIVVYGRAQNLLGEALSASEGVVGYFDLEAQPLLRVGELVEVVPGMVATQHSGTGKANQYFLRGFNLDHGTDFSASVDGVPINMRTHGHGQGYLDLNFLIPELVETVTYSKGVHHASVGDFSSAGNVAFRYYDQLDENIAGLTVGEYSHLRGIAAGSFAAGRGTLTAAGDVTSYSGPWELDEDLQQVRGYLAWHAPLGDAVAGISFSGYTGDWNSTDQIPLRAVQSGLIDELGYVDPDLGGSTDRYALTGSLEHDHWSATAYAIDYDFTLFSNFTYRLENPADGDQFEQHDERRIYGANVRGHSHLSGEEGPLSLHWGADFRHDDIGQLGLYPTTARTRTGLTREDSVAISSLGTYADLRFRASERLRGAIGLRADSMDWDVDATIADNSGDGSDTIVSPKFSLAWTLSPAAELYANWGRGFHSNDVRGVTIRVDPASGEGADPVDAFVSSEGGELGARIELGSRFNATLTAFWLDLDSELVFVGDGGATEPNGATERKGVELAGFWQATDHLAAYFSYTTVDGKYRIDEGAGREIPGAVDKVLSLGLNAAWSNRFFASARLRYLGDAPLVEDGSVKSGDSLLLNASFGYRWQRAELRLDAFNLLDSDDHDIAYYYESRLDGETEGVEDLHFHPLEPRAIRVSATWHWQ